MSQLLVGGSGVAQQRFLSIILRVGFKGWLLLDVLSYRFLYSFSSDRREYAVCQYRLVLCLYVLYVASCCLPPSSMRQVSCETALLPADICGTSIRVCTQAHQAIIAILTSACCV